MEDLVLQRRRHGNSLDRQKDRQIYRQNKAECITESLEIKDVMSYRISAKVRPFRARAMTSEPLGLMEPMMPPEGHAELGDLVLDLVGKSKGLAGMLHPNVQASVGNLVRSMNCYYSNLIE